MVAYVVARIGYEYNDEGYETSWDGNSYEDISEAYKKREDAEKAHLENTISFLKDRVLGEWNGLASFSMDEKCMEDVCQDFLQEMFPDYEYDNQWDLTIPDSVTDEQLEEIAKKLGDSFFEIIEIKVR